MNRIFTIGLVLVVTLGILGAPGVAAFQGAENASNSPSDESDEIAPGERLTGVVGVQEAELDGEVEERAFGFKVANASSDEERADVIAERLGSIDEQLADLEERKAELKEQREAGEISQGAYKAQMAKLAAQTNSTERLTGASVEAAEGLPAELLEERGINATAIQTLKERANELSGPEVSEIAKEIAGEKAGSPIGADRGQGPPVDVPGLGQADDDEDGESDDADDESNDVVGETVDNVTEQVEEEDEDIVDDATVEDEDEADAGDGESNGATDDESNDLTDDESDDETEDSGDASES